MNERNSIEITLYKNGKMIGRHVNAGFSNEKSNLTIVEMEQFLEEWGKKFDWHCSFHIYENPNKTVKISLQIEEQDGTEWELFKPFMKKVMKKFWGESITQTMETVKINSFDNSMQNNVFNQGNTYGNNTNASVYRVCNGLGDKIRNEVMSRVGNYKIGNKKGNKKGKLVSTYVEDFMGNKITEFYDEDDE